MPEELRMDVHNTVQEKHHQEKDMQEDKMVVWGGFTNNRKGEKWKAREKRKDIPIWTQSSKEQQQDIRSFLKWTMQKKKKK